MKITRYEDENLNENPLEILPIPLLTWYGEQARVLPWRPSRGQLGDPYRVWISEIMLQQTRVAAVLGYYARFMEVLPTVEDLARVDEDRLLKLWQGLGYYNRARNLQKAAQMVVDTLGGHFPQNYDGLLDLPGVGSYTAGAIGSIAFGLPVPAVDGNVLRVVARICGDDRDILKSDTKKSVETALKAVIPVDSPGDFNQAMMELGAMVCLPNGAPKCDICPARDFCRARLEDLTYRLPVKTPKKPRRIEDRRVFLLFYQGRVALRKRPEKGLLAKLWEYPNLLEEGESFHSWGLDCGKLDLVGSGRHIFTHIEWHMKVEAAELSSDTLPSGWIWADWRDLQETYSVPNAFGCCFDVVQERLEGRT